MGWTGSAPGAGLAYVLCVDGAASYSGSLICMCTSGKSIKVVCHTRSSDATSILPSTCSSCHIHKEISHPHQIGQSKLKLFKYVGVHRKKHQIVW